jgi:hypothetical protein
MMGPALEQVAHLRDEGGSGMQRLQRGFSILAMLLALGSCVEDDVVYQDLPNFIAPPAAAANYLGYYDQATDKTNCGNCHVTQQAKWEETAHSGAWETLQASGHAAATCEGCHTVGNKGNVVTDVNVGYNSTKDSRYYDVQCESCHGPGLDHVTAAGARADASVGPCRHRLGRHRRLCRMSLGTDASIRQRVAQVATRHLVHEGLQWLDGDGPRRSVRSTRCLPGVPHRTGDTRQLGREHELQGEGNRARPLRLAKEYMRRLPRSSWFGQSQAAPPCC